ncbi:unnamed protein product [Durusdinium trenchii]|uniref:CSC1-like protein At3g21620 n=2 Tax=Durusdinium trenchii TaxID=1381693 RepID=A0ABP0LME1_9DINO
MPRLMRGPWLVAMALLPVAAQTTKGTAKMPDVGENGPDDLKALVSALILNCLLVLCFLVAFTTLRMSFPLVYSHRLHHSKESLTSHRSEGMDHLPLRRRRTAAREMKGRICDWLSFSVNTSTEDAMDRAGLDATLLRDFCTLGATVLASVGIPMCIIMVPVNSALGETAQGDDHLSTAEMVAIRQDHPWLFYVHAILVWVVCITVHILLDRAQASFLQLRVRWLENLPAPRCTTVLVENIPVVWRSDQKLQEFFGRIFSPDDVLSAHIVRCEEDLARLVAKRDDLLQMKRKAELTFEKTQRAETFRPSCFGPKVDTLEFCEEHLHGLDDRIRSLRQAHNDEYLEDPTVRASHCGFVTFRGRRYAEMAQSLQISGNKNHWKVSAAPVLSDLRWQDLRRSNASTLRSELLGYLCIFGVYIAFLPVVLAVTNLAMVLHLGALQPIWAAFAPSIGLTIFLSLLPSMLMAIAKGFFTLKADTLSQHKLQLWYFFFQLIFVVLEFQKHCKTLPRLAAGASGLQSSGGRLRHLCAGAQMTMVFKCLAGHTVQDTVYKLRYMSQHPAEIMHLLADSLPNATHFYMTYLVLQWARRAIEMLRYMPLSKFLVFRAIFTPEEAKDLAEPEDQDSLGFGTRHVNLAISVVLGLMFCSISPLVTLLAMFDLILARMTYGYLVIFAETKKPDLGGVFWVTQIHLVQLALGLYCALMVGFLRSKSSSPAWQVAAPSFLIVFYSVWHLQTAYQWKKLPFEEVAFSCEQLLDQQKEGEEMSGDVYIQPELARDAERDVTREEL